MLAVFQFAYIIVFGVYFPGLWFVTNCGRRHQFICERHEAPAVNATLAPTEVSKGGCAPDWTKYKQHVSTVCY